MGEKSATVTITPKAAGFVLTTPSLTMAGTASATEVITPPHPDPDEQPEPEIVDLTGQISKVEVKYGSAAFQLATATGPADKRWATWTFTAAPPNVSPLTVTAKVTLPVTGSTPITDTDTKSVTVDTTGAEVEVVQPFTGQVVALPSTEPTAEASLLLKVSAVDGQSGITQVEARVNGAAFVPATLNSTTQLYEVNLKVKPPAGKQLVEAKAKNGRGLVTTASVEIDVALPFTSIDPDDLRGSGSYLGDLLAFTERRVKGTNTPQLIRDLFGQRVDLAGLPDHAPIATRPVSHARVAVETLRAYLAKRAPSLSGQAAAQRQAADRLYLRDAYLAMLRELGTSYTELRAARGTEPIGLAERLGIDLLPPALLDQLTLDPDAVTGPQLENVYGLADTNRDPSATGPVPLLLTEKLAALERRWQQQDDPGPVIDPDLVQREDVIGVSAAEPIRNTRRNLVDGRRTTLRNQVTQKLAQAGQTHLAVFTSVVEGVLGPGSVARLAGLADAEGLAARLVSEHLDVPAYRHLMRIRTLATAGGVRDGEWNDLVAILVQAQKRKDAPAWRQEERAAGISLGPKFFRLSGIRIVPAQWLGTAEARNAWEATLRARIAQESQVREAYDAALRGAEEAAMRRLRSDLVQVVATAAGIDRVSTAEDRLGDELFLDLAASGTTTRRDQAIELLQSLLFAIRTRRNITITPVLGANPAIGAAGWQLDLTTAYTEAHFDEEWRWMGAHGTWRAAMATFAWPENTLLPTTRPVSTQAFRDLAERIRGSLSLTPALARTEAKTYLIALAAEISAVPAALRHPGFRLTELLTDADLAQRRDTLIPAHYGSGTTFKDAPIWLAEMFFFVPMLLAGQLEKSGQYLAALGWVRTVYAYDLAPDKRKIYTGLAKEATGTNQAALTPSWLLDGLNPHTIVVNRTNAHTRFTLLTLIRLLLAYADAEFSRETGESLLRARLLYETAREQLDPARIEFARPLDGQGRQLAENPMIDALRRRSVNGQRKLRDGLNLLGLERTAAGRPTPYRYAVLIQRALQLTSTAQQIEAGFLAALEKADAEAYNLLKARQDIELAVAGVELAGLRVAEAKAGVDLASLQRERAVIQQTHFQELISVGTSDAERIAAVASAIGSVLSGFAQPEPTGAGILGGFANAAAGAFSQSASFERREQEWRLQESLAAQDVVIGDQQILLADLHVGVAEQEAKIASIQADNAQETLDFLAGKFTNAELFEWMSGVLGEVYRFFLQQASLVGRLAERQLRFERQEELPEFIRPDYWEPVDGGPGRRGLTGAEQLLRDLTRLDQYAFSTDRRRLQLTKTFSLATLDPTGFQRFRDTGVLAFRTAMEAFDRDFPGHYLRLIRGVRTSVIALIPPDLGIRATLTSAGSSRVVAASAEGGFDTMIVTHGPESVALSSAQGATGLFELDAQPDLRAPFEGFGVDLLWELRMPKAANQFSYDTIFDVLFTVEYTALDSPLHRTQVVRSLPANVTFDRVFSLRHDLPDLWFDLNNPDQTVPPLTLRFSTSRRDFPPNLTDLKTAHLLLYVHPAEGPPFEVTVENLKLGSKSSNGPITSSGGLISTRRTPDHPWLPLTDAPPIGAWELAFRDDQDLRNLIKAERLDDVILVIACSARLPDWPA